MPDSFSTTTCWQSFSESYIYRFCLLPSVLFLSTQLSCDLYDTAPSERRRTRVLGSAVQPASPACEGRTSIDSPR